MLNTKLSDIIRINFLSVELFEKYNFNYSIYGNTTLGIMCMKNRVNPVKVVSEFKNLDSILSEHFKFDEWDAGFLCDYIVINHHNYIRKKFPVIIRGLKNLEAKNQIQKGTAEKVKLMHSDFLIHMMKEEKLLFPQIKKIISCRKNNEIYDLPPFGNISNPVKVMIKEHRLAFENFSDFKNESGIMKINKTGNAYIYELIKLIKEFETNLHLHFHFENNLLFPKAVNEEKKLLNNLLKKNKSKTKISA